MLRSLSLPIGLGRPGMDAAPAWFALAGLLAAALLAAPLVLPRPLAPSADVLVAPDEASAMADTRASGHPVEALADRTEFSQTFANPSGTMSLNEAILPVRVHRADGTWTPVDYTLRALPDGIVVPGASMADVVFSGGGTGPLARIARNGGEVVLGWPGALPVPTLSGPTATYADVLPGVDLRLTAEPLGFSDLLVVKSAAAARNPALRTVRLALATSGVTLRATAAGGLTAVDGVDTEVFGAQPASMWDASGARTAPVGVRVSPGELDLVPDAAMLASPTTRFPVSIDPYVAITGIQQAWTKVDACSPGQAYWNGANDADTDRHGQVKVGMSPSGYGDPCDGTLWRSYFQMDTHAVLDKQIGRATFNVFETWSASCLGKPADLYWTGAIFPPSDPSHHQTDWADQPGATFLLERSFAHGWGANCQPTWEGFDITGTVAQVASGPKRSSTLTLMLRAPDEGHCFADPTHGDMCEWKRFDSGELLDSQTPYLHLEYNTPPNAPTDLYTNGSPYLYPNGQIPCNGNPNYVNTATPTLHATVSDADDTGSTQQQPLSGDYFWAFSLLRGGGGGAALSPKPAQLPGKGNTSLATSLTIPAGTLTDGEAVTWSVAGNDGITDGPASPTCSLTIDTAPVTTLPGITSTDGKYPVNGASPPTAVGTAGAFTFDPAGSTDVAGYLYGLNTSTPWKFVHAGSGNRAAVTIDPPVVGDNTLVVRIVGLGGNLGPVQTYDVITGHGTTGSVLLANYGMDEGSGAGVADSKGGHEATAAGSFAWTTGHTGASGDHALDFTSSPGGYAHTSESVVDTRYSFAVSAWVRLDDTSGTYTVLSQDGAGAGAGAGFYLQSSLSGTAPRWGFSMPLTDGTSPATVHAFSDAAPAVGVWTHLVGVHCGDSSCLLPGDLANGIAGRVYLYVDDRLQSAPAADNSPWQATGTLQIARGKFNSQYTNLLNGAVDDVTLYWGDPCPPPTATSPDCTGVS